MTLRCVIVDDEYLAIRILEEYAARMPSLVVLKSFRDPVAALEHLQHHETDLLFLDIQMPQLRGTDLLEKLAARPLVVFTTARNEFAVQAFELDALDYLVKPIPFERFKKAVLRAEEYFEFPAEPETRAAEEKLADHMPAAERPREISDSAERSKDRDFLEIKTGYKFIRLPFTEISLIEGLNEYVRVHTTDKKYITLAALKELEWVLPTEKFIRVHKSYIVSQGHIKSYNASRVELTGGIRLPIGRVYKESFIRRLRG